MWNLINISAQNFLSYKDVHIDIKQNKTTLVYGTNITDEGVKSNGSGKSSILEIICYGLTGNSLRKVKNKELILNDEKEAAIELYLENTIIKKNLHIIRTIHQSKSSSIILIENGKVKEELKDLRPTESDKYILEQLEISYDDIINYYLISKERYSSLFLSSDTQKKEVINRFSKANLIDDVFTHIDIDVLKYESDIRNINESIISFVSKVEVFQEQITTLKEKNYEEEKVNQINSLENKILTTNNDIEIKKQSIKDYKIQLKELNQVLDKYNKQINSNEKIKNIDLVIDKKDKLIKNKEIEFNDTIVVEYGNNKKELDDIVKKNKAEINTLNNSIRESNENLAEIDKILAGEIECPSCGHHFILNNKEITLDECRELKKEEEVNITNYKTQLKELNDTIDESNTLLDELENDFKETREKFNTSLSNIRNEINSLQSQKTQIISEDNKVKKESNQVELNISQIINNISLDENNIERLNELIDSYNKEINQIKEKPDPNKEQIKNLHSEIKKIEELKEKELILLENKKSELDDLNEWLSRFKRFKSFLANQSLSLIEDQANYFLNKMKSNLQVYIEGFRELSNKKIKEEITIEVSRDGLTRESFSKFSGGEKAKADISCILSMQELINNSCLSGGLNLLFCDEILESVDDEGMNHIVNSLSNINKTIFIIAHSQPNENINCNQLLVQKKNKISEII